MCLCASPLPSLSVEGRRQREAQRRQRDSLRAAEGVAEESARLAKASRKVRLRIARELLGRRQDKLGWMLQAEREWQQHVQQLVHERGIWPCWGLSWGGGGGGVGVSARGVGRREGGAAGVMASRDGHNSEAISAGSKRAPGGAEEVSAVRVEGADALQWQLDGSEGPCRMRKRLRRRNVRVDLRQWPSVRCLEEEPVGTEETEGGGRVGRRVGRKRSKKKASS